MLVVHFGMYVVEQGVFISSTSAKYVPQNSVAKSLQKILYQYVYVTKEIFQVTGSALNKKKI